jgi:hypothetical protein
MQSVTAATFAALVFGLTVGIPSVSTAQDTTSTIPDICFDIEFICQRDNPSNCIVITTQVPC